MMKITLTKNEDHYESISTTVSLLEEELEEKLRSVDQIVIKINFVSANNELATTPIDAVKAFIDQISIFYTKEIIIAEEATEGSTREGFKRFGYKDLADSKQNVFLQDLTDDETFTHTISTSQGEIRLNISKLMQETPFLASITRAKTHNCVTATLSIKNVLVGAIQGGFTERSKIHLGDEIHEVLANIAKIVYPDLGIIDGTVGMQGLGPVRGDPIRSNWSLASLDPLAADTLAAELMGSNPLEIRYFDLIRNAGLGEFYDERTIAGSDPADINAKYIQYPG